MLMLYIMYIGILGPRIYRSILVYNCRLSSISIVLRMESIVLILLVLSATVTQGNPIACIKVPIYGYSGKEIDSRCHYISYNACQVITPKQP